MKILFVYFDINVRGGAMSYPFAIGMLSGFLKAHGHETRLHYMFEAYDPDALKAEIVTFNPDVIAFSAVSPQFKFVRDIFRDLQPFPAFTVLGGQHATLAPECLADVPGLNAVCIGEGEYPLLEVVDAIKHCKPVNNIAGLWVKTKTGEIVRTPPRPFVEDLDTLPFPDREFYDYQAVIDSDFNTALFMFSRGCPYNCTFCSNHALRGKQSGQYVRFRSVDNCLAEIRAVTTKYRVKTLYFNDDCFTAHKEFIRDFCAKYKQEFKFPFDINARPETLNDEICRLLKDAGCRRVSIGVENGSEQFRRDVLGRRQSNDAIIKAFACCRNAGLKTKSFNIVGFPLETPEIFEETVKLNARINPDSVIIGIFEPYPGTKLADVCFQEKFLDASQSSDYFMGRLDTALHMPNFPRREILRCFRNFAYNVYKQHSFAKALSYKIYYSPLGQPLIRILGPIKDLFRRWTMGV